MLVELGILEDVLAEKSKHDFRDEHANIGEGSLLSDSGPNFAEELLDVLTCEECVALLCAHFEELSGLHVFVFLSFYWFSRCRCRFLLGFELIELLFESADFLVEVRFLLFEFGLVGLELVYHFSHGPLFLIGLRLGDGSLELGAALFEVCGPCGQLLESLASLIEFLFKH